MGNLARSIILVFVFCFLFPCSWEKRFQPTWDSLDTHVAPPWYDEAKFGIFMTWGLYSIPSFGNEWFWSNWKGIQVQYLFAFSVLFYI